MKQNIIITLLAIFITSGLWAQKDPAAEPFLNKFSKAALDAPSVKMSFDILINDRINNTSDIRTGEIIIKGDLYMLSLPENIIWFNGKDIWTFAPEVDEVTVTLPDPDGETFFSSPSSIFTLYKEGYKYRLIEEKESGIKIDLYPEDLMAEFTMIRLLIGSGNELIEAEYKRKDGIDMTIKVKNYDLSTNYDDSFFSFDKNKYKNVDIIDMR